MEGLLFHGDNVRRWSWSSSLLGERLKEWRKKFQSIQEEKNERDVSIGLNWSLNLNWTMLCTRSREFEDILATN